MRMAERLHIVALDTTKVGKELLRLDYFWGPLRLTVCSVCLNINTEKTDNALVTVIRHFASAAAAR
jgi:hypothetical protein